MIGLTLIRVSKRGAWPWGKSWVLICRRVFPPRMLNSITRRKCREYMFYSRRRPNKYFALFSTLIKTKSSQRIPFLWSMYRCRIAIFFLILNDENIGLLTKMAAICGDANLSYILWKKSFNPHSASPHTPLMWLVRNGSLGPAIQFGTELR